MRSHLLFPLPTSPTTPVPQDFDFAWFKIDALKFSPGLSIHLFVLNYYLLLDERLNLMKGRRLGP